MRTRGALEGRVFRYFSVRVVLEIVVVVGDRNRDEGKVESLGEPMRGSRDSGEYFMIVCKGKIEISFNIMGSVSSDHTATSPCLDRVIIASGG